MHQRTILTLSELEDARWFSCVGKHDSNRAVCLDNWEEAIESSLSNAWESLCHEAANQYRARLAERNIERFRKWNSIVREIKTVTVPLVRRKTQETVDTNHLPKAFVDTVQWDVLHLCMEAEYADVYPQGFFASQAYWYVKGHFPCGWQGNFPDGHLVIF